MVVKSSFKLWLSFVLGLLFFFGNTVLACDQTSDSLESMLNRIVRNERFSTEQADYFNRLTRLYFNYLEADFGQNSLIPLFSSESIGALRERLKASFGNDVFEFGEKMFRFFEDEARIAGQELPEIWKPSVSEHFVFFTHPESIAEGDIDIIKDRSEESYRSIVGALDMASDIQMSQKQLHSTLEENNSRTIFTGKIAIYLHQTRDKTEGRKIGKQSMGSTRFGATILESGPEKGKGKLTAAIDVLYFNAFSQIVIDHEIAHAVLMIAIFDPASMLSEPMLTGESDLRKVFLKGYKPVLPFLHEGVGDYVIYYLGFYTKWPLLPRPEKLVQMIIDSEKYIPLKDLLEKDLRFRMEHPKEFSLEGASFIDFVINTYGKNRLKTLFLEGKKGAKKINEIFEINMNDMEKKWHAYIEERLDERTIR